MNIPYRIEKIETRQFAIFPDEFFTGEDIDISTSYNFAVSKDIAHIRCITNIQYEQKGKLILILEIACHFGIGPEGVSQIKQENNISVKFLRYMATIAIGTARGIIHSQTQSTPINAFVLPPINLIPAITEDMKLNIN
ncbi:hypothetical protein [Phocaeicola paurosaccharolyticus]|uniref:hypothetical protein n=1 Tax=Phocaeicola paurosaccharolyticus TaxID=732242 RepID=UPI00046A3683|nr:hypothetical protein [Phocaeicola paurosaccharolyticus]